LKMYYSLSQVILQISASLTTWWERGSIVVEALFIKPEGRGFETRRGKRIFFNLIVWWEWPASRLCYSAPRERTPSNHWKGDWVGPIAGMNAV
jgi:hypothetical protein